MLRRIDLRAQSRKEQVQGVPTRRTLLGCMTPIEKTRNIIHAHTHTHTIHIDLSLSLFLSLSLCLSVSLSLSLSLVKMEHEREQDAGNDQGWRSCCLTADRDAVVYFSQLTISLCTMAFAGYQLIALENCEAQSLYSGILTMCIGIYIPSPRLHNHV